MKGTISDEIEVNVSANEAWQLYGTLRLSEFILQELPTVLDKVDVIEGDGGTGTVLKVTFPPGTPGIPFYGIRFEVIDKDGSSCITKFTVSYEVKDVKLAIYAFAMVEPLQIILKSAKKFLTNTQT